jgi:regulator of sirC expression with transglutaminase-like and TPR domain
MLSTPGSGASPRRWAFAISVTLAAAIASATLVAPAFAAAPSLIEDLERIEADALPLCPLPPDRRPLGQAIAELGGQLRAEMNASTGGEASVQAVNDFVFKKLAIQPSRDLHDPCNLLPSAVLERKQGYCVGIAAVYLALAEKLGLPIHAVATPSHVFLRYAGDVPINIETFENGAPVPDDRYIAEQKIAPESIRTGVFLRDLSDDEFLAIVHGNLGVVFSHQGKYVAAAHEYEKALHLDRHFPAAWYNWGNDLLVSGEYPKAIKLFTRSLSLHPNDPWALNNRGMAYRKRGKEKKARRDFEEALTVEPGFEVARKNLEGVQPSPY